MLARARAYLDFGIRVDDVEQVVEALAQIHLVVPRSLIAEQLTHRILGRRALWEITDLLNEILEALHAVELNEAEKRSGSEVVLESGRRLCRHFALGPCKVDYASLLAFSGKGSELDFEVLFEK